MCKFRIIERNKNGRIFYIVERKTWLGWSSIKADDGYFDMEFPYLANAKAEIQRLKEYYYPEIKDKVIYEE